MVTTFSNHLRFLQAYILILVTSIEDIGAGYLDPATGYACYPMKYKAIVFRPYRGEVLDAIVTSASKVSEIIRLMLNSSLHHRKGCSLKQDL